MDVTFPKKPSRSCGLMLSQLPLKFRHVFFVWYQITTEVKLRPPISSLVPQLPQAVFTMFGKMLLKSVCKCLPSFDTMSTRCMVELDKQSC